MLFSDIEGSTSLLSRLGSRYADALDLQRSVLRSAWDRWGGIEMGTEGDSFFVVFEVARDAVNAALQAQRGLAVQDWPAGERVAVRMGLHTGEPVVHDGGYVGMDVHRAARIAAAAHGGQLVVSEATRQLVAEFLPADAVLIDLGWHRLKDFAAPVHIHQLSTVGLPDRFPALRTLGAASSLPLDVTPLLGRDGELGELGALLGQPGVRLVTLTGPGGSGKTRLGTALAAEAAESFADGVFFVPAAGGTSGEDMWSAVIDALAGTGEARTRQQFLAQLANRRLLVVLDNLEQIDDAGVVVDELLAAAPQLVVVATSRRPLHVRGEHEHPVPPLELPESDSLADAEDSGAVQLFCRHARMVRPGFALTTANAADVAAICRRLDGLPLAVELAAARSKLLSPAALLTRLTSTVELRDQAIGRPARHQALRDTIAWSYDMLPSELRMVFRRLGVFAGGADLDAVTAVAGPAGPGQVDPLDAVASLVDVSLAQVTDDRVGEPRVALLQTVADFAVDRLVADGDLEETRGRHAEHYLSLAEHLVPQLWTGRGMAARQRLQTETDNFRAALTWVLQPDTSVRPAPERAGIGLRLCAELAWFWGSSGYLGESRRWYERALEVDSGTDSPERAQVMIFFAYELLWPHGHPRPLQLLEESLAVSRRLDDPGGISLALTKLAEHYLQMGDTSTAADLIEQAIPLARQVDDGRFRFMEAVGVQAGIEDDRGNYGRAIELIEQLQELAREHGNELTVARSEVGITGILASSGRVSEALSRLNMIAGTVPRISNYWLTIMVLGSYAHVCACLGDAERAARLLGAHWSHFTKTGATVEPEREEPWLQRTELALVRDTLGKQRWELALQIGGAYSLEEALEDGQQAGKQE